MLHAALNRGDPLNQIARNTLDRSPLLSPFSLQETNLLGRAGKLEIRNYDEFAKDLGSLLSAFSIKIINDRPKFHSIARTPLTADRSPYDVVMSDTSIGVIED